MPDLDDPYIGRRQPLPMPEQRGGSTALLVIDMQYADAHMEYGMMAYRREIGQLAGLDYFAEQLATIVPNIARLQAACRAIGVEVVFTRIQSMTASGRDRGGAHEELKIFCPPGSREAQILDELAPLEDELVFRKNQRQLVQRHHAGLRAAQHGYPHPDHDRRDDQRLRRVGSARRQGPGL